MTQQPVYRGHMIHPGERGIVSQGQHMPISMGPAPYLRGMPPQARPLVGAQGMCMPPQYGPAGTVAYGPRGPTPQSANQRITHMAATMDNPGVPPVVGPIQSRFPPSVGKTRPTLLQDQPLLLEDLVEKVQ